MKRILSIADLSIDLGNIKTIRIENYGSDTTGQYVIIELLKGKEYVFNQETGATKLIKPLTIKGFGTSEKASYFLEKLTNAWDKYLTDTEKQTST